MSELPSENTSRFKSFLKLNPEVILLSLLMLIYLFIGTYFAVGVTFTNGVLNVSGGSDPYYNFRAIEYVLTTHHWLVFDSGLNYPVGSVDPRTPFFHWFVAFMAVLMSPFMNVMTAAKYVFLEFDAVFGALLIIPVYLIAKEVFGKRAGMIAAILYTLMPSNLSSGILSDGRMHTPELFFAFFTIYFFLKAINETQKKKIITNVRSILTYPGQIMQYFYSNRIATIYSLLAGASLGGLMLSWQGYAYIEAIIIIYVFAQIIVNIFRKKSTQYLTYHFTLFAALGFLMGSYYYIALGNASVWFFPPLYLAIGLVIFGIFIFFLEDYPWIFTIPFLLAILGLLLEALNLYNHSMLQSLLSGEGYFIKTRVYDTIAEAASPPLGQYISGFGPAQFILGLGGLTYVIYLYLKDKRDGLLFILIFSAVSIYMSFAAARFNVTAAPAYAVLGSVLLLYFADLLKVHEVKNRRQLGTASIGKSLKGNVKWIQALFVAMIVILLVIPSGFTTIAAGVPGNNEAAVNNQIYNSLPGFLRPVNYSANNPQFVGAAGPFIDNASQPLAGAFQWLSTQNTNVPFNQRPAFVSWWDYGFQELSQGNHPTVADDFQQGYEVAGQILLAQNQSQIISLFIARVLQGSYANSHGNLPANVTLTLQQYLGIKQASIIQSILVNPVPYEYLIFQHPATFGEYISSISTQNAYFALMTGLLSSAYSTSLLVNLYSILGIETGYNIQYIGIDHSLFPSSGLSPGIFYAPAYLTDKLSYTSNGEIVPYQYYQILEQTSNGTYPLNQTPAGATPTNYIIQYNSAFYNTSIYRFMVGYPPQATGNTTGIPGLTFGNRTYAIMPAWNMSHFELSYIGIPWNPYKNYSAHPNAWKIVSLQQAYYYSQKGIGIAELFPPVNQVVQGEDTIVSYYPGATISGRVTQGPNTPVAGLYVTLYDQYGIPHDYTTTNSQGYYNLTAVPGNDTIEISYGSFNHLFLGGSNSIKYIKVNVTDLQAERIATAVNTTTGMPNYDIIVNYQMLKNSLKGSLSFEYQTSNVANKNGTYARYIKNVHNAEVFFYNSTYGLNISQNLTNGIYQFTDIPPYDYQVSALVNGTYYADFQQVNVTTGAALNQNLYIYFDSVFADVSYNGVALNNYTITLNGSGKIYYNQTNSTGRSIFWITPGEYSVNGTGINNTIVSVPLSVPAWGLNKTVNLTPALSVEVTGRVAGISSPSYVSFYSNGNINDATIFATTDNGSFSGSIPVGIYTVFYNGTGNVFAKTLKLTGNTYINIVPGTGYSISVTGTIPSKAVFSGVYEIIGNGVILEDTFTSNSTYNFSIPGGNYNVVSSGVSIGHLYYSIIPITLGHNTSLNMLLNEQGNATVDLFDSSIVSSYSSSYGVGGSIVTLYSDNIPVYYSVSGSTGVAPLYYPSWAQGSLNVTVKSPFYLTANATLTSNVNSLGLKPYSSSTSLMLKDNGVVLPFNGTLQLTGTTSYNLSINDGTVHGLIRSGLYAASIRSSEVSASPATTILPVSISVNSTSVVNVVMHAQISAAPGIQTMVFYPNGTLVQNTTLLNPGVYSIYSYSLNGANISNMYVHRNETISPMLVTSYNVFLSNSIGNKGGTYLLNFSGTLISLQGGDHLLPAGAYNISYYNQVSNTSGNYIISGSEVIHISSLSSNIVVPVKITKVSTVVSGTVTQNGLASPFALLELQNGNTLYKVVTNISGYYSLTVAPGNYNFYAYNNASSSASFGKVSIPAFRTAYTLNIKLLASNKVNYWVDINGKIVSTNITISTNTTSFVFNTSVGMSLLPVGFYSFSASVNRTELNGTGQQIVVPYTSTYYAYINSARDIGIDLTISNQYQFNFTQLSKPRTVSIGSELNYSFRIFNSGYVTTNLTFLTGNSSWNMTFKPGYVSLKPGISSVINVSIDVPKNATAGFTQVPVILNYSVYQTTELLNLTVKPSVNFTIYSVNTFATSSNESLLVPFQIKNTGNTQVNISLSFNASQESLIRNITFWNLNFSYLGHIVNNVTVPVSSQVTVYVLMQSSSSIPKPVSNITVYGQTQGGKIVRTIYLHPSYMSAPVVIPYPKGNSIVSNYTGSPYDSLIIGLVIIAAAVLVGLIGASIRGRKNR